MSTIRVKISFTVDIDAEVWSRAYGIDGVAEIRKDVKAYVENVIIEGLRDLGHLAQNTTTEGTAS